MLNDTNKILTESIKRLLRRNAFSHLRKIVNKTHAADLAAIFITLPNSHQHQLFDMLVDISQKGELFRNLEDAILLAFISAVDPDEVVAILEAMPKDDVADLLGKLPENQADDILACMHQEGSAEVEDLLRYQDDTAGGIMVPDFIALKEDVTAGEAIKSLQKEHSDVEMPFYLYVVDQYGKLVGVLSLRQLVVVSPQKPLKNFMSTEVFAVQTDMDQEEVAKLVARYNILAVPVVDKMHCLVGIVTVDDVIDIFRKEATEDILKMAGAGEAFIETKSILKSTRIRLPWLFASWAGGLLAFLIINRFESTLSEYTFLAAFLPVIMGMGGNIGTQSSTIVVRGLATGLLQLSDIWSVVSKELAVGVALGVIYGILIGLVAHLKYNTITLAFNVGMALICSMSVAALVGSLVPMLFARFNIDPAVATGPFVTTAIDVISIFFYFQLAVVLFGIP